MPDPFAKVQPGDPIQIPAITWNAMLDVARRGNLLGLDPLTTSRSSTIIRIKNETDDDLDRYSVVALDGPLFDPMDDEDAFLREVVFRGVGPGHLRRCAITLEPAPIFRVVRAIIAGVTPVMIDVAHESHEYAKVVDDVTGHMESSFHGHARILWREGDGPYPAYATGLQWAIVMLGVTGSSGAIGLANGNITPRSGMVPGTGQVDLYHSDSKTYVGADLEGPIGTVNVLNASGQEMSAGVGIMDGIWCAVEWDADDVAWVSPLECEPYG